MRTQVLAMNCGVRRICGSDLVLLWLWCRPAAVAPIQPLAEGGPKKTKEKDSKTVVSVLCVPSSAMVFANEKTLSGYKCNLSVWERVSNRGARPSTPVVSRACSYLMQVLI